VIYAALVRECAKLECRQPAEATAALRYRERVLWIGDLLPQRDPNLFDICGDHAARLTAPYGWSRLDQRASVAAPAAEGAPAPVAGVALG
jgi:hypothetical protein